MFRLRLLGTPHLEGRTGVVPQGPRRIALLASLATAGPGGLTRDKLVARLWPDADGERAKRNLSQLLYAIRTELGEDLVEGTGTLRLDPARCSADVSDFDAAIAERRDADALACYAGPFLDGFHLSESSEFSQWADTERDRRAAQARQAAARAAEAVPAGDHAAAALAWRRTLALDPLSAPLTLRLMEALAASGDRAGAIRIAEQHAALVRAELDSDPDVKVAKRAEELRHAPAVPSRPVATLEPTIPRPPTPAAAKPMPTPLEGAARLNAASPVRSRRGRTVGLVAAAALAVIALLAWSQRARAPLGEDEFVLIAEFANGTNDTLLTRTVGTAFAAALQQSAYVVPLPRGRVATALRRMELPDTTERMDLAHARDVAEREGVRLILTGEVIEAGGSRRLVSRIIEARTGRTITTRTFVVSEPADLLNAIDRLAAAMRRDLGEARATVARAVPLPDVTTTSLPALHEYAAALDAERRSDGILASNHLERAVTLDSNFAAAHAKLGEYYSLNNDVPNSSLHYRRALAQVDRLPLDEALRIRISAAWARGDRTELVHLSRSYLEMRPRDAGAWSRLAFALFSSGQQREARDAYAVADSLSPLSAGSILNIGTSWLSEGRMTSDRAAFDSARAQYERAFVMQPSLEYSTYYNHQYGTILVGVGLADSARATFDRMTARDPQDRARGLRSNAFLDAIMGRWRSAARRFAEAAELSVSQRQWTSAIRNDALHADLLLTLGDRAGARAPLSRATAISLREPLEARALAFVALAQVRAGNVADGTRLLERMRAASRPDNDSEQAVILEVEGALHLAAGRGERARQALDAAFVRDSLSLQIRALLARATEAAGRDAEAASHWARLGAITEFGVEGQFDWQFAAYEQARILERLGRTELAVDGYRRILGRYPVDANEADPPMLTDARARLRRLEGPTVVR